MKGKKFAGIFIQKASFYLLIIFILLIITAFLEIMVAVPGFIFFMFLLYYNFKSNYKRKKEITQYIENLTFNIDMATKDTLLNFPMPLVLIELDGTIIWYNSSFKKVFEGEELLEKTIQTFAEELNPESFSNETMNFSDETKIHGRNYCVLGNFIEADSKINDDGIILLLYFIDNTELVNMKKIYNDEKVVVGIFIIDNYDDLMQSIEDTQVPQMFVEIETKLNSWTGYTGGIVKKYERDKYLFIFENKYLKSFQEKKFDILDSIKEINIGNKIPVTLSIGIGKGGDSLLDKFRYANAALDIALGRGGDQVVIKDGEEISFYGGKTREIEKRTRVKARVIAFALRELIDQSSDVIIMGHKNCDIDCLGAALGIYSIAKKREKQANIVLNKSNSNIDSMISKIEADKKYENLFISSGDALEKTGKKTLLVIVDTHKPSFTETPDLIKYTEQIVVIDHHRRGADYLKDAVLTYQETYASSTCELLTEILQYVDENVKLNSIEAEALYAGIMVDTKNFTFKTGVRTFEAAAFLRRQGVDTVSVKQMFQNDLDTYIHISNVVRAAKLYNDSIAISICPSDIKNATVIAAQAADQLVSLKGLQAAFVLCDTKNGISISGRSLGDINVQIILEKLGGGGHLTFAGAQLKDVLVEEAIEKLKESIEEYKEEIPDSN
ncbi:DHH family phosphoesterase [Herbivorax sp. ANBcel31]|uniref:DHH family phosphoesterase n=1 Tax=Herbivorax sp. ANBcel31 TaxID=3069754 RepID=UPI0027B0BFCB|nr:DHH family phosphoesterase [Herbivorax sp. ANBcel31]MDQ2085118.1 DHH family phosphoesterase [Herbivorax sp. ANBcel31]